MKDYMALPAEEKERLVKLAADVAFQTETVYGNCMQSVLNGLREAFPDMGITPEMIKAGFGMAGGCGTSLEGTCGALAAAAFAISIFYGRPLDDLGGKYGDCHALIRKVIARFKEIYGSSLCRDVLKFNMGEAYDWKTPEGLEGYKAHNGTFHDAVVVAFCAEAVAQMLVDGQLTPGGAPNLDYDLSSVPRIKYEL